jgi:hypothetical protein
MKCAKNIKENSGRLSRDITNKVLSWYLVAKTDINVTCKTLSKYKATAHSHIICLINFTTQLLIPFLLGL